MRNSFFIQILCLLLHACTSSSDEAYTATLLEVHDTNPPQILLLGQCRNICINAKGVKRHVTFIYSVNNPNDSTCMLPVNITASANGKTVKPTCSVKDTLHLSPKEKTRVSITLSDDNLSELLLVSDTLNTTSIIQFVHFENTVKEELSGTSHAPTILFTRNSPVYVCAEVQLCKTHNRKEE